MQYSIGTAEPHGVVGSRVAKSDDIDEATKECIERSKGRGIKEAWLREFRGGKLGPVIVAFKKGRIVN